MKKLTSAMFTFLAFIISFTPVFAKDIAVDIIDGEHDCYILATVIDIDGGGITADYYCTVGQSEVEIPEKVLLEEFSYSYCKEHADGFNSPKMGDNFFAAVSISGGKYVVDAAYKTSTVDTRTLNIIVPLAMENKECMTDVAAVAYFIRSNGTQRSFEFGDGTVSIFKDDREFEIFPGDSKSVLPVKYVNDAGEIVAEEKQQDVIAVNPDFTVDAARRKQLLVGRRILAFGIIISGLIIGMVAIYIRSLIRMRGSNRD